jgi:hypothetical protein
VYHAVATVVPNHPRIGHIACNMKHHIMSDRGQLFFEAGKFVRMRVWSL